MSSDEADPDRQRRVDDAVHTAAMEALTPTPAAVADHAEYVHGRIDSKALLVRALERHRVH